VLFSQDLTRAMVTAVSKRQPAFLLHWMTPSRFILVWENS